MKFSSKTVQGIITKEGTKWLGWLYKSDTFCRETKWLVECTECWGMVASAGPGRGREGKNGFRQYQWPKTSQKKSAKLWAAGHFGRWRKIQYKTTTKLQWMSQNTYHENWSLLNVVFIWLFIFGVWLGLFGCCFPLIYSAGRHVHGDSRSWINSSIHGPWKTCWLNTKRRELT